MNIYDAIMKAADHIEQHPDRLNFCWGFVAEDLQGIAGSPVCHLGWVSYFAGHTGKFPQNVSDQFCREFLGIPFFHDGSNNSFVERMNAIAGIRDEWTRRDAAKCLRLYAAKYHAPTKAVALRTDSQLVADLMRKITTERIPEDVC